MFKNTAGILVLLAASAFGSMAMAADADPTLDQVYQAANAGHLVQAQQMMQQVLRDHPDSARAHYVTAELDARAGDFGAARQELAVAEHLKPGLPFAKPQAVSELRAELARGTNGRLTPNSYTGGASGPVYAPAPSARASSIPWIPILFGLAVVLVIWMIVSRRRAQVYYQQGGGYPTTVNGGGLPPTMGGPGYGGGYPAPGYGGYPAPMGGGGSGLLGNLATGAALGAGMVAGEELVHRVLEPGRADGLASRPEEFENRPVEPDPNANMGGDDFGIQGGDSGWDDNSGGGFGGGDSGGDWS